LPSAAADGAEPEGEKPINKGIAPVEGMDRGGWTCLRSGAGSLSLTGFLAAARQQYVLVIRHAAPIETGGRSMVLSKGGELL
jgi:hypothetical protein